MYKLNTTNVDIYRLINTVSVLRGFFFVLYNGLIITTIRG